MRGKNIQQRHPERYEMYKRLINCYAWQLLRRRKIASQPLCEDCLAAGRVTPAEEVHHVIPVERGRTPQEMRSLAYDFGNLVSLCRSCHQARHNPQGVVKQGETVFTKYFFSSKK